ncbi:hypothetical protein LINPERHAP2_LOCUS4923 [Linum perenne]
MDLSILITTGQQLGGSFGIVRGSSSPPMRLT